MGILSRKGSHEMQFVFGHIIQVSISEEQGNTGSEFSQSHSNDTISPILRLTSYQPQVEESGEGLNLKLGKDRVFRFSVTAPCGWRHGHCWKLHDPYSGRAATPQGTPKLHAGSGAGSISPGRPRGPTFSEDVPP